MNVVAASPADTAVSAETNVSAAPRRRYPRPPVAGRARPFRFPEIVDRRLASGPRLLLAPIEGSPIAHLRLVTLAGAEHNPPGRAGLANVFGVLLHQGNRHGDAGQILATLDRLGTSLESGAGWDAAFVEGRVLSRHVEPALEKVLDSMLAPTFPEARFEAVRRRHAAEVERRGQRPRAVAAARFAGRIYGESAYGYPLPGTAESLAALERDEVLRHQSRFVGPETTCLLAVGGFDPDRVVELAEGRLDTWELEKAPESVETQLEVDPSSGGVDIVPVAGAGQAELVAGHAGPEGSHPDHPGLLLLARLLQARLEDDLRQRRGLTYGVEVRFERRRGPGPLVIRTAVETARAGEAAARIRHELETFQNRGVEESELRHAREQVLADFAETLSSLAGLTGRLEQVFTHGLAPDHFARLPAILEAIDAARLQDLARRHLKPRDLALVAAGDPEKLRIQAG